MYVAITRTEEGLGASVHVNEQEALDSVGKSLGLIAPCTEDGIISRVDEINDSDYEWLAHPISLNLFQHVADPWIRLALITHDETLADQARGRTFSAWWDDNNKGDRPPALDLPHRVYDIRQDAILRMGDDAMTDDPLLSTNAIPKDFFEQLTRYWSN